jgi:hypothetical protein
MDAAVQQAKRQRLEGGVSAAAAAAPAAAGVAAAWDDEDDDDAPEVVPPPPSAAAAAAKAPPQARACGEAPRARCGCARWQPRSRAHTMHLPHALRAAPRKTRDIGAAPRLQRRQPRRVRA